MLFRSVSQSRYAASNTTIVKVEQFPTQRTLQSFPLKNIDDIREKILYNNSTSAYIVDGTAKAPYGLVVSHDSNNKLNTTYPQYGLAIKTYQSDIFNNWLNTTTVNNITSKTNISTATGSFSIDTLVTSKKIWEMLNKIAIAGGTYEDWLNTMFTNSYHKNTEIPVYIGGMSQEIVFQEILSNSATANEPLGTLAGRGILSKNGKKGGKIKIRVDEPSYLIGISSITPRIMYSQGNDYDDLILTMDDFHKPALDQIGFQDLLTDKMLWSQRDLSNPNSTLSAGKQPAWIDYKTNFDESCGNFAAYMNESFMVLNREYSFNSNGVATDINTYIDPTKYNHIFADQSLDNMNFWVQILIGAKVRRGISASLMPKM